MAHSIRISDDCYDSAQAVARSMSRSLAQQVEHWVRIGMRIDMGLTTSQLMALVESDADVVAWANEQGHGGLRSRSTSDRAALRHAVLDAEVASGRRSPDSLIAIPTLWARKAKLKFPESAFGGVQTW